MQYAKIFFVSMTANMYKLTLLTGASVCSSSSGSTSSLAGSTSLPLLSIRSMLEIRALNCKSTLTHIYLHIRCFSNPMHHIFAPNIYSVVQSRTKRYRLHVLFICTVISVPVYLQFVFVVSFVCNQESAVKVLNKLTYLLKN